MITRYRARSGLRLRAAVVVGALLLAAPSLVLAKNFTAWGAPVLETGINSPQADGCPIESPNGLELYIASTRPGAVGGATDPNDIWYFTRASTDAPWSAGIHLPEPINSAAADFCPTPLNGGGLLFVSTRAVPGACGAGDMYYTRFNPKHGWSAPVNLGCQATGSGPNFPGGEFSPSLVETAQGTLLYFSSTGFGSDQNIYVSRMRSDGSFEPAVAVNELNTASHDQMPNVSRDGLEIVFSSDRQGPPTSMDVYTSSRASTADPWGPVVSVTAVNTAASETRASLSGDGERLHFGRSGEVYVSERTKITGGN